ncbi:MAG: beta-lactamase family protein [Planctomycetaceae bacterium]|nr:beta-lactamase family protein [Planctomycetaceae bacterium]
MIFSRLRDVVEQGQAKHLHLGIQVSVASSQWEFDLAFGERKPGEPLTPSHGMFWLSAAKPITAICILQLQEQKKLSIDAPLETVLPEWEHGEVAGARVTLRHLLTHTSPLHEIDTGWPETNREEILRRLCQAPLKADWRPGERAAYLPSASWFLLGEIVARASGMTFNEYVQRTILEPLGMLQTRCQASPTRVDVEEPVLYDRVRGELHPSEYLSRLKATIPSPGSSFRGPARELRLIYDGLLRDLRENTGLLLKQATVREMTHRQRAGLFDETLQHKVDYGLGLIIDSKEYGSQTVPYGFGEASSRETFGHGGSQCAIGFADPASNRSVVIVANGRPGEGQHQRRFREMLSALEADLNSL